MQIPIYIQLRFYNRGVEMCLGKSRLSVIIVQRDIAINRIFWREEGMDFDKNLLMTYKKLVQTTELVKSYQEFLRLFRFLRVELEKEMPDYRFQGNIVENGMDYSYFQFTNDTLKKKGLKIAVTFVHRDFQFEVWLSGFNRKFQCRYYELLKDTKQPFFLTEDPNRSDYILRIPLDQTMDISDGGRVLSEIKEASLQLLGYMEGVEAT